MKRRNVLVVLTLLVVAAVVAFMRVRGEGPSWITGKTSSTPSTTASDDQQEESAADRQVLGRIWFDKLPTGSSDTVTIALWLPGGLGIYEDGSRFRFSIDVFDFERRGNKLDMTFLHDKRKVTAGYAVAKCDDKPPFDLCLTFDGDAPKGPKKLYGFGDEDDAANRYEWFRGERHAVTEEAALRTR